MEGSEVVPSRLVDQRKVEHKTALWIQSIREALDG
jgi:hypothetical protein